MNETTLTEVLTPLLGCCIDCPTKHPCTDEDQRKEVESAVLAWLTDDEQIARLASAYIRAYHETPWLEFVTPDQRVQVCMSAAIREVTATEATA